MDIVVVERSHLACGQPTRCCSSKVLEGQVVIQMRLPARRFEDPWLYLHAECVGAELADAPPGRPVGGVDQAYRRILAAASGSSA